jgi:hypothetical protein
MLSVCRSVRARPAANVCVAAREAKEKTDKMPTSKHVLQARPMEVNFIMAPPRTEFVVYWCVSREVGIPASASAEANTIANKAGGKIREGSAS